MLNIDSLIESLATKTKISDNDAERSLPYIANKQFGMNDVESRVLIKIIKKFFDQSCKDQQLDAKSIRALTTKFRDAGRRSAPWKPTSGRVPGRPQDGSDGNRINRWLLPIDHKFYATEVIATLVEVKYYLQALSMQNAPQLSKLNLSKLFYPWLIEHAVNPGEYLDPVQMTPLDFTEVINDPRTIQSGHIFPLDRGGKHHPSNTFLMLFRSNQIQGNLTISELLSLMRDIVSRHDDADQLNSALERSIRQ